MHKVKLKVFIESVDVGSTMAGGPQVSDQIYLNFIYRREDKFKYNK